MTAIEPREATAAAVPLPCERELLDEARAVCRERLAVDPQRPRELNLLGLLAGRAGEHGLAVGCLTAAAALRPTDAQYVADLATALARAGRDAEAIDAGLRALTLDAGRIEIVRLLGRCLHRRKQFVEATAMYDDYLRRRPDDAGAIAELAEIRCEQGPATEAIERYEAGLLAQTSDQARAGVHGRIGQVHLDSRGWAHALAAFREALRLDSGRAEWQCGAGRALMGLGRLDEAVAAFREALDSDTMHADAASQLVCALELLGRRDDAARAWLHLGVTLEARDQFGEASVAFRQALARKPDCLDALLRLGHAQLMLGRPAEAVAHLRAGVAIEGGHMGGHFALGCALQLSGDWHGGWDEFAWLSDEQRIKSWRIFEQPRWDGSSLEGKAILFWAGNDYGLGDTIHLVRFARHLKRLGARVIVECQPRVAPIIGRMPDVDHAAPRGAPLPAFDVHAPMMWVPVVDRSARGLQDRDVPYLSVDEALVDRWRGRRPGTAPRRVGLCWGGKSDRRDAHRRFASLAAFAPLTSVPDVTFVSLQMGPQADEVFCAPPGLRIVSPQDDSHTLDDTAALVTNLDLVITVDTMIAHLAGALGRPVWTLLPYAAEWRWLTGERTPWYPTMRLFRQTRPGEWADVVEQVRVALAEWAAPHDGQA